MRQNATFDPSNPGSRKPARTAVRWIANVSMSSLHAADAYLRGRTIVEPNLASVVAAPADAVRNEIFQAQIPSRPFWRHLLALAHQLENNRELATMALRKTIRWGPQCESLAAAVGDRIGTLETAVRNACPGMIDQLDLRSRPLREQWEARGPGLLRRIGELTDERLIVDHAEVVLVHPALGGGGAAHLSNNSVRIEAVLTNSVPALPEVVRLGWLLAQLQSDLPIFSEAFPADRVSMLAQLALLPATLQAAQEVELAEFHLENIMTALVAWQAEVPAQDSVPELLQVWWQTYRETRPKWPTALAALDQLLRG